LPNLHFLFRNLLAWAVACFLGRGFRRALNLFHQWVHYRHHRLCQHFHLLEEDFLCGAEQQRCLHEERNLGHHLRLP